MTMMNLTTRTASVVVAWILAAGLAAAQMSAAREPGDPPAMREAIGADLGTGWNILSIPAAAFTPINSTVLYTSLGYITASGAVAEGLVWAPVFLPSGAGIGYLGYYFFDSDGATSFARIMRYYGYGTRSCPFGPCPPENPGQDTVAQVTSNGSSGYGYSETAVLSPLHTVNNNTAFGGGNQYAVLVSLPNTGSHAFKGVDIWWKRQISPAPSTASFTDVPAGSQFFAEIEAMRAAGITAGCTATTYCPDANVTRRQMAAFFARALGLYWGY